MDLTRTRLLRTENPRHMISLLNLQFSEKASAATLDGLPELSKQLCCSLHINAAALKKNQKNLSLKNIRWRPGVV
jgi:hypothetical protein